MPAVSPLPDPSSVPFAYSVQFLGRDCGIVHTWPEAIVLAKEVAWSGTPDDIDIIAHFAERRSRFVQADRYSVAADAFRCADERRWRDGCDAAEPCWADCRHPDDG